MYDKNTVYVIGHGKTNKDNAITEIFKIFFIGFVINIETDEIIDVGCSATVHTTEQFVSSMFIGKKMYEMHANIEEEITRRYFGTSQKSVIVAYKDALKKYKEIKEKYY